MDRESKSQNTRVDAASQLSSHQSVAGPSTPPTPAPQIPAATTASIREIGTRIMNLINDQRKKTPTAQALADTLQTSLTKHCTLLNATEAPDVRSLASLQDLNNTLGDVQSAVKAELRPRKRHVMKGAVIKLFGMEQSDIFSSCRMKVINAFQALELVLLVSHPIASTNTSQQGPSASAVKSATPSPSRPGWGDHARTALDTSERVLEFAVGVGEAAPLAGSILKAVASIGLSIIKILNGVVDNKEEAQGLAKYVQDLVATAERFTENSETQIGEDTLVKLKAFEATLKSVHGEIESFMAQGGFRQGVSHIRNKEVLAGCDTQIRRSFTQLQVQLSLDSVRLLGNLGNADAQRARRDLLDRLGDADTGATDKASDPADLMCLEGTRVELLTEVDNWASDPLSKRVLWINGVAGCGKSAIAATIASQREQQSATAIFHFSRSNQPRNKRVICSIARQLAKKVTRGTAGGPEHLVLSSVQADPDIASSHLSAQFKHLLVDPLSKLMPGSPPVLIIIDALDEWDNLEAASKLVHLIHEHNSTLHSSIKFILTGRKESHLSRAFGAPRIASLVKSLALDIAPRATVDQDIRTYLVKHLDRIGSDSFELSVGSWPGTEAIEKLVKLSGGLFQWASTVIRFVEKGSHEVRLKEIFERPNQLGNLDALYRLVLTTFLQSNDRTSIPALLQHVLGAIVVAPTPISLDTLVYLHASDQNAFKDTASDIKEILAALGSLLIVPLHPNEPIRVLHPSIIDFLTDENRCTDVRLRTDRVAQNRRLALHCLERMQRDLKRDMCGIDDPRRFNADPDVQALVSKHILDPLQYACRYWAEHLLASGVASVVGVDVPLESFCTKYMLCWLEVMSLTGMFQQAVAAIKVAEQWATLCPPGSTISTVQALLNDARRFLLMYSEPITANAAQVYLSALSTAPSGTSLARTYREFASMGIRVLAGPISEYWPGSLWVADRHLGGVTCCAFSPRGNILASGSYDNTLRLWDIDTGVEKEPTLKGHTKSVSCLAFSPDGKILASGSDDRTLRLWDIETGVRRGSALKGHTGPVSCLAFSSDGRTLASGSWDKTLRMWDVETGVQKGSTLEGHIGSVSCMAFWSDSMTLASGSWDKTLRLWDVETGAQKGPTLEGHTDSVNCLAFSSDGSTLASGSRDSTLRLWNVETGEQKGPTLEGHSDWVNCLAFASDGSTLASGSDDKTLRLWDIEAEVQDESRAIIEGHTGPVNCLAFSSDNRTLASGSDDKTLRLWDVETRVQKGSTLQEHTDSVKCLAFSSDGGTLASGSHDSTLRLWNVETGAQKGPTLEGHTDWVNCLAFSSDGSTIASGSRDSHLRLWDVKTGVQRGPTLRGHTDRVNCLAFSPDSMTLASGSGDSTVLLWNVETGEGTGTLRGHELPISCLEFSPNGRNLASGSWDKALHLWDVDAGVQTGPAFNLASIPTRLEFSPSGGNITVNSDSGPIVNVDVGAYVSPAFPDERAFDTRSTTEELATSIGQNGWVLHGTMRWFWLPPAFGRGIRGELRDERFVFRHGRDVCMIDVSEIMYLI